jgi:hypothetical protein
VSVAVSDSEKAARYTLESRLGWYMKQSGHCTDNHTMYTPFIIGVPFSGGGATVWGRQFIEAEAREA